MDSLINYQNTLARINEVRSQAEDEATSKADETKEKIRELTGPFEAMGIDSLENITEKTAKNYARKMGLSLTKVKNYQKVYKENGTKGVLNQLKEDGIAQFKGTPLKPREFPTSSVRLARTGVPKPNIDELLPQEFAKAGKGAKLRDQVKKKIQDFEETADDDTKDRLNRTILERAASKKDIPDNVRRIQHNVAQADRTINEFLNPDEVQPLSIGLLNRGEFQKSEGIIRSSLKSDIEGLDPLYKNKYNELIKNRLAKPSEIADDFERNRLNLNQMNRTLEEVRNTYTPRNVKDNITSNVKKIGSDIQQRQRENLGVFGHDEDDEEAFTQAQKAVSSIGKANQKAAQVTKTAIEDAGKSLKSNAKQDLGKLAEKAIARGGEVDGETGGPEDPLSDIAGLVIGGATFLGGLFGARKIHKPSLPNIPNVSYQMGA